MVKGLDKDWSDLNSNPASTMETGCVIWTKPGLLLQEYNEKNSSFESPKAATRNTGYKSDRYDYEWSYAKKLIRQFRHDITMFMYIKKHTWPTHACLSTNVYMFL